MSAVLQTDKRTVSRIHVVSCYAPTRAAMREDKDAFFQELNNIISGVPVGETYIILGIFNTCVGSRESDDNEWSGVKGHTGLGQSMMLGKSFCPFSLYTKLQCATHGATHGTR